MVGGLGWCSYLYLEFRAEPVDAVGGDEQVGLIQIHDDEAVAFVERQNQLLHRSITTHVVVRCR